MDSREQERRQLEKVLRDQGELGLRSAVVGWAQDIVGRFIEAQQRNWIEVNAPRGPQPTEQEVRLLLLGELHQEILRRLGEAPAAEGEGDVAVR